MKSLSRVAWCALVGLCAAGELAAATYTFVGGAYASPGAPFTTAMRVSGSFTTAAPLPANLPLTAIGPGGSNLAQAWTFNDGLTTYTQADSTVFGGDAQNFSVATDAAGDISAFRIAFASPLPPHSLGQPVSAVSISSLSGATQVDYQQPCLQLSGASCSGTNDQVVEVLAGAWSTHLDVVSVPALGRVSMLLFTLALSAAGVLRLRARRTRTTERAS